MQVVNYQKELEKILTGIEKAEKSGEKEVPTLFLHSCCAPCSSYVLRYLRSYFKITVFYYNPNITEMAEYRKRAEEQIRLIGIYNEQIRNGQTKGCEISYVDGCSDQEKFLEMARPLADCPEGGERCFLCYEMRLRRTAEEAVKRHADYFGTTLTISPLKNAVKLNEIGQRIEKEMPVLWLPSDFKKKEGYKQSIELSREYGLYRQDFCGCVYSKAERERQRREAENRQES